MKHTNRIQREAATVEVMIRRYCQLKHSRKNTTDYGYKNPCPECRQLIKYSNQRLENCPFQEGKTTCGKCKVHCYKPKMRERIREVMRVIGPRMLMSNPLMAVRHSIDGLRRKPSKSSR